MKKLSFLLLALIFPTFSGFGREKPIEKLIELNHYWSAHSESFQNREFSNLPTNESGWISFHLSLVEKALRSNFPAGLNNQQLQNRNRCLDFLYEYRQAGRFPQNNYLPFRTPVFIDEYDNFCAVGYLIKATGHEALSRKIARSGNLNYVKDMHYPELFSWADEFGFSPDELAWIQPTYSPLASAYPLNRGLDGEVYELFPDHNEGKLYIGGKFVYADDTIQVNNIACLTESSGVYTWHKLGNGVGGTVSAITGFQGKIYAAVKYDTSGPTARTEIVSWDGSSWLAVACVNGSVYDLVSMENDLFISGSFAVCGGSSGHNFAKMNGGVLYPIPGLIGHVNTMKVLDSTIVLGGAFSYNNNQLNVIKWSKSLGFQTYGTAILNEVTDFELFYDTLYASCKRTSSIDSINLIINLIGNHWLPLSNYYFQNYFYAVNPGLRFNTLCRNGNMLMTGGNFTYSPPVGRYADNCYTIRTGAFSGGYWFAVDSEIHKMVIFKNDLIVGGKFISGFGAPVLNRICRFPKNNVSVLENKTLTGLKFFPNPVKDKLTIDLLNSSVVSGTYKIISMDGRCLSRGLIENRPQILDLSQLSPGTYLLTVSIKNSSTNKLFLKE